MRAFQEITVPKYILIYPKCVSCEASGLSDMAQTTLVQCLWCQMFIYVNWNNLCGRHWYFILSHLLWVPITPDTIFFLYPILISSRKSGCFFLWPFFFSSPCCLLCMCMWEREIRFEKFIGWRDWLDGANFGVTRRRSRPRRTTSFQSSVHRALLRESQTFKYCTGKARAFSMFWSEELCHGPSAAVCPPTEYRVRFLGNKLLNGFLYTKKPLSSRFPFKRAKVGLQAYVTMTCKFVFLGMKHDFLLSRKDID